MLSPFAAYPSERSLKFSSLLCVTSQNIVFSVNAHFFNVKCRWGDWPLNTCCLIQEIYFAKSHLVGLHCILLTFLSQSNLRCAQDRFGGCSWRRLFQTVPTVGETGIALTHHSMDSLHK